MKVRIPAFTIDVDFDAWELNYGTERSETRKDVQNYAESIVREHFASMGVLA